jgi:uridine monophosphate synthetase
VIYAANPREAAQGLRAEINQARGTAASPGSSESPHPFQELILQLYDVGCVQFGHFTLASGVQSPLYIDLRRLTASPGLLRLAARAYADLLQPLTFDRLAAVPYAALTIGTAAALAANCSLIYPRKEAKAHGTGQMIEGVYRAGERVAVIEDLITSGGSILKAIETLEGAGLLVSDVLVLIDREQSGAKNLAEAGYRLHAVLYLSDILRALHRTGRISTEQAALVERYLDEQRHPRS